MSQKDKPSEARASRKLLGSAYDREDKGDVLIKGKPSPRPKDAATLILLRPQGRKIEVLMGKRAAGHRFMPDKYVFPGGRVERHDGRIPALSELHPKSESQLGHASRRKARAFALTAIRETFEETGLIVGKPATPKPRLPEDWQPFFDQGAAPSLYDLRFIGRAITPPYRPQRYDARFFIADARTALIDTRPPVDGVELHDLQWIDLEQTGGLDLPSVTQFMLNEIKERWENPGQKFGPVFLRWTRSGHRIDRL